MRSPLSIRLSVGGCFGIPLLWWCVMVHIRMAATLPSCLSGIAAIAAAVMASYAVACCTAEERERLSFKWQTTKRRERR